MLVNIFQILQLEFLPITKVISQIILILKVSS